MISAIAALMFIACSCLAFKPGSTGYSATWLSVLKAGVEAPTDYLHFWNPAVTGDTDQGPGGNDGDSLNFDPDSADGWNMGTDDTKYVLLDGPITNGTSYTVTAWIKPAITAMNANQFGGWIVSDRTVGGSTMDFQLNYNKAQSAYRMAAFNSSATQIQEFNTNVTDNVWQHLAAVVDSDAGTIELFVDGVSDGSTALTITPNDSYAGQASIGIASWNLSFPGAKYHGSIGKVRFYQRALTQAEIQAEIDSDGGTGP